MPLTYLGDALRQVMVNGTQVAPLGVDVAVLTGWLVVCLTIAARSFPLGVAGSVSWGGEQHPGAAARLWRRLPALVVDDGLERLAAAGALGPGEGFGLLG